MKLLVLVAFVSAALVLAGCSAAEPQDGSSTSSVMLNACMQKVADWSGTSFAMVSGHEVNEAEQNPSGSGWDFSGKYSGGAWRCGGAAGEAEPSSVMVYPVAGSAQDIVHASDEASSQPKGDNSPVVELAKLTAASSAPSAICLSSVRAYAAVPEDATDDQVNAAAIVTAEDCGTAGQYIRAMKVYPAAAGFVSAAYIDGKSALDVIQTVCYIAKSTPVCVDAAKHGLL